MWFLIRRWLKSALSVFHSLPAVLKCSSEHLFPPKSGISEAKSTKELMSNECFTLPQLILSLYLAFAFPLHIVIMTPSSIILIPVILVKLLNNMLQIRLHSHNSSCHLQYIILQTYRPTFTGRSLKIIVSDIFRMRLESGASFPLRWGITLTYLSLPKAQQAIQR